MADYVDEIVAAWSELDSQLETDPIQVISRILRASQLLQARLDAVVATGELSHKGDLDTLTALRRAVPDVGLSPTALARIVQLTSGGMTNRLDRLESAGLVERRPDHRDGRSVTVRLTADGARIADKAFSEALAQQETLLAALSNDDRVQLAELLRRLLISLGDLPQNGG